MNLQFKNEKILNVTLIQEYTNIQEWTNLLVTVREMLEEGG